MQPNNTPDFTLEEELEEQMKLTNRFANKSRELQQRIDKAIEYINHAQNYGTMTLVSPHYKPYVNGNDLLEILKGDK